MKTKFGVHHPTDYGWTPDNLGGYCKSLKDHGCSCYTLWADSLRLVDLCRALIEHGIEVIYRPGEMRVPDPFIVEHAREYYKAGARYVQLWNEPNLKLEWRNWPGRMAPSDFAQLVNKYHWIAKDLGFTLVIAPLSPGGDFFHRDFFNAMMQCWSEMGVLGNIWDRAICGIHNRPITNEPDSTNPHSFNEYKWYRQTLRNWLGKTVPMIAPEAFYEPTWCKGPDGRVDWQKWHDWNMELIVRHIPGRSQYVGEDFLASCFWLIHDDCGDRTYLEAGLTRNWYYGQTHGGETDTNLWGTLARLNWQGESPSPPDPSPKPQPGSNYMWVNDLKALGVSYAEYRAKVWAISNQPACLNTRRDFREVDGVVFHHSGVRRSIPQHAWGVAWNAIKVEHKKTCPYHLIIEPNGTLAIMDKFIDTPPHSGRWEVNRHSIAICLIGNFQVEEPTQAQLKTLEKVLISLTNFFAWVWKQDRRLFVAPHRWIVDTECPGDELIDIVLFGRWFF